MAQENAWLKAKEGFQKIEETIRQATIQDKRIDAVEENLRDQMLSLGYLMTASFAAGQGAGDLGQTLEHDGRIFKRLDRPHAKSYVSVFGALPPIGRAAYGTVGSPLTSLIQEFVLAIVSRS